MNDDELFIDCYKLPKTLSKEEVYDLIDKTKQGDLSAREKLVEHNIRLVLYVVINKFKSIEYDKKDLVSIGNIGLMKAINTFDTSKKVEFSTYATRCIDNEILMFLRKNKKYQSIDSIDRTISYDKDGNDLNVKDTLSDDLDIEEEYIENETYSLIRKLVNELPDRDREIVIMFFGFCDDKRYTQGEIAAKFNIAQSYVSRIIKKSLKQIENQLEKSSTINAKKENQVEVNKIVTQTVKKDGENAMSRKIKTIYEYFNQYTREEVDEMLGKLTEEDRKLVTLRYGEDLDHPHTGEKMDKQNHNKFYGILIPKMKRLLINPNNDRKRKNNKENNFDAQIIENDIATTKSEVTNEKAMTKEDYIKQLELLRTPTFTQMMNLLGVKDAIIISLRLGYVDGKYFSSKSIADFLGIEELEVIETTKRILIIYKENINQFIDNAIQVVESEPKILDKKK